MTCAPKADYTEIERRLLEHMKSTKSTEVYYVPEGMTQQERDAWKIINLTRNYGFVVEDES